MERGGLKVRRISADIPVGVHHAFPGPSGISRGVRRNEGWNRGVQDVPVLGSVRRGGIPAGAGIGRVRFMPPIPFHELALAEAERGRLRVWRTEGRSRSRIPACDGLTGGSSLRPSVPLPGTPKLHETVPENGWPKKRDEPLPVKDAENDHRKAGAKAGCRQHRGPDMGIVDRLRWMIFRQAAFRTYALVSPRGLRGEQVIRQFEPGRRLRV